MKVIFLGTGEFSAAVLERVYASRHSVLAVVTQPDRINGRHKKIVPSPVSLFAAEKGIKIFKFERIGDGAEELKNLGADIMLTASYGQLLPDKILSLTPCGVINTHASLLPKYRGASPIQAAIAAGEKETGVTIMKTVKKMDAGDIICAAKIALDGSENSAECFEKLALLAGELVVKALDDIESGSATYTPQDESQATYCKKLEKADGKLDFSMSAEKLNDLVRAYYGFPGTYFYFNGKTIKIIRSRPVDIAGAEKPGTVVVSDPRKGFVIRCGAGALEALVVQGEGGKAMPAGDYLRGHPIPFGSVLE